MAGVRLTPRCRQILCLAALSNQEIARKLGISAQTIKNHWSEVYRVLERIARERGMHGPWARSCKRAWAVWVAVNCHVIEVCELDPGPRRMEEGCL